MIEHFLHEKFTERLVSIIFPLCVKQTDAEKANTNMSRWFFCLCLFLSKKKENIWDSKERNYWYGFLRYCVLSHYRNFFFQEESVCVVNSWVKLFTFKNEGVGKLILSDIMVERILILSESGEKFHNPIPNFLHSSRNFICLAISWIR